MRKYMRLRRKHDLDFRLRGYLRNRIYYALKLGRGTKSASTLELLGCTIEELRLRLERQFAPGMSWDNYGRGQGKWSVDHIKSCASFDLTGPMQQRECFNYRNLQPLWDPDNIKKGCK